MTEAFVNGEYGQNLLKKPSLLSVAGSRLQCADGHFKLADGKQTFTALRELKAKFDALGAEERDSLGWSSALLHAITEGVDVAVIEFPEWDEDVTFAWAVAAHDTESNKYKATTLQDLVGVANRYRKRVAGGSWQGTQALLETVYGNRRMFIYRMVRAAQALSPATLALLAESGLPPTWVHENKYFLGSGPDAGKKLSEPFMRAVIEVAAADRAEDKPISANSFQGEYCAPMRHAQAWLSARRRDFGEKLCSMMSFGRVEEFLKTDRARLQVLKCMRANIRLEGTSDEQPGIPQCRALVAELKELQGRAAGGSCESATGAATPSGGDVEDAFGPECETSTAKTKVDAVEVSVAEEADPIMEAALAKTDVALSTLTSYESIADAFSAVESSLVPSSRLLIFIDVPTSKPKILLKLVEQAAGLTKALPTKRVKVVVSTGGRISLAATALNKLTVDLPNFTTYTVQLAHGAKQFKRRRPGFMLVSVPPDSAEDVPSSIPALAAKARSTEFLRMRCLDAACPLRPKEEFAAIEAAMMANLGDHDAACEMNPDDMDDEAGDADIEEMAVEDEPAVSPPVPAARPFVVDLWPFAFCSDYYKSILNGLYAEGAPPHHMIHITTSGHPAPQMAAADLRVQCATVYDRVRPHGLAHGQAILRDRILREYVREGKAKVAPEAKRIVAEDLSFVSLSAPPDQTSLFDDVPANSGSAWRAGLDQAPPSADMERVVPELVAAELEAGAVAVVREGNELTLVAARALKDGEVVLPLRCLLFSNARLVAELVNANAGLLQGAFFVVKGFVTASGGTREVYAVPVGAGMYLKDFRARKGRANAIVAVNPAKGCNDGLLTIEVSTRNGCGIASGSAIAVDFGEGYRNAPPVNSVPAKRFRGALDAIFGRQACEKDAATDEVGANSAAPSAPPPPIPTPAPPAAPAAQVQAGDKVGTGEVAIASGENFAIILKAGAIVARPLGKARKIMAKTVLHTFTAARVDEATGPTADLHPWKFTKPKDIVIFDGVQKPIGEVISSRQVEHLWCHNSFAKGVAPPAFVLKKSMFCLAKSDTDAAILKAAASAANVTLVWQVTVAQGKIMPVNLAMVTKGQVVTKEGEDAVL